MNLKAFSDERGSLLPIEFPDLPFKPQRIFVVTNVPENKWRGEHAHFKTTRLLICLKGKIKVKLISGKETKRVTLRPFEQVLIPPMVWDAQQFQSPTDVLLVLCNNLYDARDYIRDFNTYQELCEKS